MVIASTAGLSTGSYLGGSLALVAVLACLGWGAWRLGARLLPEWRGAPARLVEILLVLFAVMAVADVFGAINLLRGAPVAAACAVVGLGMGVVGRCRPPAPLSERRPEPRWEVFAASIAVALVTAQWVSHAARALHEGMNHGDTLTYHGPFAARFLQNGTFGSLAGVGGASRQFYPQNSELLHAVAALPFHRDLLSPLLNLGWAALVLLSAWCIGRRHGVGAIGVLGAAFVLGLPTLASNQPGQASSDVMSVALLLAAVALLLEGGAEVVPVGLAGVAAGLAVGTKVTTLAPVVVLTIGLIVLSSRRRRWRFTASWCAALALSGCYWAIRNLVVIGNPAPFLDTKIGPISLRGPAPETGAPVVRYVTDGSIWRHYFLPGLAHAYGPAWPLVLVLVLGASVAALHPSRSMLERIVGLAAIGGAIAYPFTPLTADGHGASFQYNLRYLAPVLLLGFVLLALWLAHVRPAWRFAAVLVLFGLVVLSACLPEVPLEGMPAWPTDGNAAGVVAALVLLAVIASVAGRQPTVPANLTRRVVAAALVAGLVIAGGWFVQRRYFKGRYAGPGLLQPATAIPFRGIRDASVAVFGTPEVYPMFGTDLSNRVTTPSGPTSGSSVSLCRRWKTILSGRYSYVVLGEVYIFAFRPPQAWFANDPAAVPIARAADYAVFHLTGHLNPGLCPAS